MADNNDKRLTLRLDSNLYNNLQNYADSHNQSLNSAILTAIEKLVEPKEIAKAQSFENFEQRHLIGQVVQAKNIDLKYGVVMVKGLVYRYLTENNQPIKPETDYVVTNINGNVVIIKEREQ